MNNRLLEFYNKIWPFLRDLYDKNEQLSWPLLLSTPDAYEKSKPKIMILGQQPLELGFDIKTKIRGKLPEIGLLIKEHQNYSQSTSRSPFWAAFSQIHTSVFGSDDCEKRIVWSNLFNMDDHNKRPGKDIEKALWNLEICKKEIEILNPNVLIFFCGPHYYDDVIRFGKFDTISKEKPVYINDKTERLMFYTYHPKYLRISRNWNVITHICDKIKELSVNVKL